MLFPKSASRSTRRWLLLAALLLIAAGLAIRVLDVGAKPDSAAPGLSSSLFDVGPEAKPAEVAIPEAARLQQLPTAPPDASIANSAPPPAAAHRAPANLRQQDRQRLQDDPDLGAFAIELKARADTGDADAAMALSDLHDVCQNASRWVGESAVLTDFDRNFFGVVGLSADQLAALAAARRSLGVRCANWAASDGVQRSRLAASWAARAVAMGHPGARLSAEARYLWADTPSTEALERGREIGLELLRQRDPQDLLRYGSTLSPLSPYEYAGFVMAACLLDTQCAADPMAFGRDSVNAGAYPGFPNYLTLNFLGPRDRWISERQAEEIVALWRAGRFDLILPSDLSSSGGGG